MELSVEAVAEQRELETASEEHSLTGEIEHERKRLAGYFRVWRIPDSIAEEMIASALSSAARRTHHEPSTPLSVLALEEADQLLCQRFRSFNPNSLSNNRISHEERLAILWSGQGEKFAASESRSFDCEQAFDAGCKAAKLAHEPQRMPETNPMVMETSLTQLPSFRMISGWFALITLIVLAFIFTR